VPAAGASTDLYIGLYISGLPAAYTSPCWAAPLQLIPRAPQCSRD